MSLLNYIPPVYHDYYKGLKADRVEDAASSSDEDDEQCSAYIIGQWIVWIER